MTSAEALGGGATTSGGYARLSLVQKFSVLSFLCVLVITVTVCATGAALLRRHLVKHDAAVVADLARTLLTQSIPSSYFTQVPAPPPSSFATAVAGIVNSANVVRVILYDAAGRVLWSDDQTLLGRVLPNDEELRIALGGLLAAALIKPGKEEHQGTLQSYDRLEEVYIPIRYGQGAPVVGALEIYRDPPAFFAFLDRCLALVWALGGGGGVVLYVLLFGLVRRSSRDQRLLEQELTAYTRTLEERVAERTRASAQRAADIATLYAVSSAVTETLEPSLILHRALERLLEAKGFDAGAIILLSRTGEGVAAFARRGVPDELVDRLLAESRAVAETGKARWLHEDPGTMEAGFASFAFIPVRQTGRSIGALMVGCRRLYHFIAEDRQLLAAVARQLGVAIGNAELYEAAREREREARILYETTRTLSEQTDLDSILRAIVQGAVTITGASYGGVGFPDGDEMVMQPLIPTNPGPLVMRQKIAESAAGLAYVSGQPQVIADAQNDPRVNRKVARRAGIANVICTPLRVGGLVIGVLFLCNKEGGPFTERDLVLLTTFASHAAAALENTRLQAETVKRERDASILFQTSTRLHEQTEPEALLRTIVQGAIEIVDATCGGLGQIRGDHIIMRPLVGFSLPEGESEVRLPLKGSEAGLSFETEISLIVNDLDDSVCEPPLREAARAFGVRNYVCVPLRSKAATLGIIKVCNKRGGAPFTKDDVQLLMTFATHAALTIENARLFHEIKTAKEYQENLIESSIDAIVTLSRRGVVTFMNRGGQRMFGYADKDLSGMPAAALWVRGRKDFREFRRLLAEKGRVQNHETELYAGERTLSVNISASLLRDSSGRVTGTLAVVKDVTDLRKLHEQMVRSERLAATGLLAAGVAHEIGNPLTSISSLAQVLVMRGTDPITQRGLEDVQVHVGRIEKIVHDLTTLARPAPFRFRESSLNQIVEHAVGLARHNPAARKMRITIEAGTVPPVRVAPDQLVQVCLNLILNAADAGGALLKIGTSAGGGEARVVFSDTGRGLSAEELRRVFDPFYTTKDADRHLGLGLFVSHEIVRQHGGGLHAESEPGQGATFTLVLPVES